MGQFLEVVGFLFLVFLFVAAIHDVMKGIANMFSPRKPDKEGVVFFVVRRR